MNTFERNRLNRRISEVGLGIALIGIGVIVTHSTVYQLFPWIATGAIGIGVIAYLGSRFHAPITSTVMYGYGFVLPAFGLFPYGHDGILLAVYSVLSFVGVCLLVTTIDRFGSPMAAGVGFAIGAGLSTGILYVL